MERFIHNHVNDITVFNNYSGREKFRKRGFKPEKIVVIQNAIEFESHPVRPEKMSGDEIKDHYSRKVCQTKGLFNCIAFL